MNTRPLTTTAFVSSIILVCSTGLLLWSYTMRPKVPAEPRVAPVHSSGMYTKKFYDQAYLNVEHTDRARTKSGIVAHHLLVADKVAEVFETLGSRRTKTVVLMSPNHFSAGTSPAQVSLGQWDTPYGIVDPDIRAVETLLAENPFLSHEETAYTHEHGIATLTPFVKRSFPNAQIVPLIIDESLDPQDAQALGQSIADHLPRAVVIASIDMSHNLPEHTSNFHDTVTMRAIARSRTFTDLEIDANAVLETLMSVNEARRTERFVQTHHGNSIQMGATTDWRENTSHILGYFKRGGVEDTPMATLHFLGDIMLDRSVRRRININGSEYPWNKMERFLKGVDLRVGNLEGTVNEQPSTYTYEPPFRFVFDPRHVETMKPFVDVVSLANNHTADVIGGVAETRQWLDTLNIPHFGGWASPTPRFDTTIDGIDITLIGYHQFKPNTEALVEVIEGAKDRFVIVMPHWGEEYVTAPSNTQRELAQLMVNAGADLIIGGHPHVAQGIEIIGGVPVLYSLGNFVFDQEIPETWEALTAGVIIEAQSVEIHLMPVWTRGGQPTPLDDAQSTLLLQNIAEHSSPSLQTSIQSGILTFDL